ncbi:MAG: SDR family NAD(P)-dependent oxidoreductase [Thermoleophilaceae bacterium]
MRPPENATVLVTGATDGLGRAVAERLAVEGATVLMHGRDTERLAAAESDVEMLAGADRVRTYEADLASLEEVRELAAQIRRDELELHAVVNNAGIGSGKPDSTEREESRDGHELRFAVNYLAGFLLTHELLALLVESAPSRIVNVASLGQAPIDFDDPMIERGYDGSRAYSQSKLAQISWGLELAERLDDRDVTVNSLHPATYMPTKIVMDERGRSMDTLEAGVEATVRLVTSPELEGVSGRFFDRQREAEAHSQAYDPDARRRLWDLSMRLTGAAGPA